MHYSSRALELNARLGLPPLNRPVPCHGFYNCCVCSSCTAIAEQIAERGFTASGFIAPPKKSAQPWAA